MRINGSYSPLYQEVKGRSAQPKSGTELRAPAESSQQAATSPAPQASVAPNKAMSPVGGGVTDKGRYQVYSPVQVNDLASSKQQALIRYQDTQSMARNDQGSGEYLGGVDIYV